MAVNSRDLVMLERALTGHVHPEVIKFMIKINEDLHAVRQQVMTLAGLFDRMAENQANVVGATIEMQKQLPHIQRLRQMGMEVGSDPTLTGEHDEKP